MEDVDRLMTEVRTVLRDRRVFITGHTGFKGGWLCLWLYRFGAKIFGYSLDIPTNPSFFAVANIRSLLTADIRGDVRDSKHLVEALCEAQPHVVFHLAAQPLVVEGFRAPAQTFETNVLGTVYLLEALRTLNRPCAVVVVTSDKCYQYGESDVAYREMDPLGGNDPYSASKGCAELVTAAYRASFFMGTDIRVATARAGNVLGGGDWSPYRVVPDAIRALSEGQPIVIRNPAAVRPWQYILEPLFGYLILAVHLLRDDGARWAEPWNFGPNAEDEITVRELIEQVCREWGSGTWIQGLQPEGVREPRMLRLDSTKAQKALGWRPRWRLQRAVAETVRWYKAYYNRTKSVDELAMQTIESYEHFCVE